MATQTSKKQTFNVEGMGCAGCASSVQNALRNLDGVSDAHVILQEEKADVTFNPDMVSEEKMRKAVDEAGYTLK